MSDVVLFPEMLEAGLETLTECRKRGLPDNELVVAVYLSMEAIARMREMRDASGMIH